MMRRKFALATVLLCLLLLLQACGGSAAPAKTSDPGKTNASGVADPGKPKYGGTLRVARPADASGLDVRVVSDNGAVLATDLIFNPLVRTEPDLSLKPELATEWKTSSDGKTWTFTLRDDVTFHDGSKMTAEDVAFTFNSILDPKFVSKRRDYFTVIDKVEAVNPTTVRFILKAPYGDFLNNISLMGIVPKAYVEKVGDDKFNQAPIGTGPFQLVDWVKQTRIVFKKNPNYFKKGLPYLDQVIMRPITEDSVRISALEAGEIDLFQRNVPPEMIDRLKADKRFVFEKAPQVYYHFLALNNAVKPLDNKKVRQAIAYAIDRKTIVNDILKLGTPGKGPINPASPYFDPSLPYYEYNPAKAKQLLADAGYPNGFDITLSTFTYPDYKKVGEMVQNYLSEVGIRAKLDVTDWGVFLQKFYAPRKEYQIGNSAVGAVGPDAAMYGLFHSKGTTNNMNYSNPDVDRLLEQGRSTQDEAQRKKIYSDALRLILDDSPMIFIGDQEIPSVHWNYVKGFVINPILSYNQLEDVWLDK